MQAFTPYSEDPAGVFQTVRKEPDLSSALVVLDTNVLLAPYRSSSEALDAIVETYTALKKESRLVVPAQVAREFARNRPALLTQLQKTIQDARGVSVNGKLEPLPILSAAQEYQDASRELQVASQALRRFRELIEKLSVRIASWEHDDPVLQAYRPILEASVVRDLAEPDAGLHAIKKARFESGLPPGNKDANKEDGGLGDVAIWLTILELGKALNRDLVFITEERKADWFHKYGEHRLFPRYELVEEYAHASNGRAFGILSLSTLLKRMGARDEVVAEVRRQEVVLPNHGSTPSVEEIELILNWLENAADIFQMEIKVNTAKFPEVLVESGSERIGVELVRLKHPNPFDSVDAALLNAISLSPEFSEISVVFVGNDSTANRLANRFAEERYFGRGVGVVVLRLQADGALVLSNLSTHPLIRAAFPPGHLRPDFPV